MKQRLSVGAVIAEKAGEDLRLISAKTPALIVLIPAKRFEAWALRQMREEALQPEKKA
jgi:hypothetical protein